MKISGVLATASPAMPKIFFLIQTTWGWAASDRFRWGPSTSCQIAGGYKKIPNMQKWAPGIEKEDF